ncbi:MAG: endo-1,4-beta-xylanase [Clostridia bacterium]|nr:endo-1,4-beta-xylanase [Clostridia bacterium]
MKKLLVLLLALLLCIPFALADDAALVVNFEDGQTGPFGQSGSCSVAVTDKLAHEGGKALAVTNRSGNNWDAADLGREAAGIALGDQVTLTAWVYVDSDEEGTFVIAKSAADYGWLANATIPGKTWTEMTATFTLQDDVNIRFQNYGDNWNSVDFYIDDVTVTVSAPAPSADAAEMTVTTFDFEGGVPAQFIQSGACVPTESTAVVHSGSSSLWVTGRTGNNWDATDLTAESMGIVLDAPARITAWVYVDSDEEGTFVIAKAGGDYATLGQATFAGRTWTQVTAEFALDQPVNIRFQNLSENWNNAEYYIDDVVVEVGAAPEAAESTAPPIDYTSDFSEGTDGWYARSAGGASISVTDEQGLLIVGRTSTWNSPGRDFELVPGKTYNMSVLVKQDQLDSTGFILSIAHTRDDAESYENLGTCTAKKGEWTMIQATYVAGRYDKYVLYVEGGAADTEFQIKEFTCAEKVESFGLNNMPSLKELYADKFDFGTAVVGSEVLDESRMDFYKSQFTIFTAGNEMKPDALLDFAEIRAAMRKNNDQTTVCVNFDSCIPLLDWAQANGVKVHGHTLVWHSQTPPRFFHEDYATHKPLVSREVMLARMENYIKQVLTWTNENYPGVIVSWDVVNEAANDGGRKLRDSLWTQVVGDDFVNRAFEYARKYAAEGTLLFYNDYNTDSIVKGLMIGDIIDSLIADGTIDGYGFQSHYSISSDLSMINTAWINIASRKLQDGTPLLLRVSELDVGIPANDEDNWRKQAAFYGNLFNIYEKYADQIIAVHTWGTVDDLSWRASEYPLLFDSKAQPKYAFWQLADPTQIPAK